MRKFGNQFAVLLSLLLPFGCVGNQHDLPLYYYNIWGDHPNFGDHLNVVLAERILGRPVTTTHIVSPQEAKWLAIGSVAGAARGKDVVWGSGFRGHPGDIPSNGDHLQEISVRAVRGPLTRQVFVEQLGIPCPEVYGDPALLLPRFFPEFKRADYPVYAYVIVPHISEMHLYPKDVYPNVIYPNEPWDQVVAKICNSAFVIAGSLHGIIVAEAFGVPARLLRTKETAEPIMKYRDYYMGTNRNTFHYATTLQEALALGGEPPHQCDLEKLYRAFPADLMPDATLPDWQG